MDVCRHVVKLEKEALDLGLVSSTTAKVDEQTSTGLQDASSKS